MTMLSFKQIESNCGNKEPSKQGFSWIIKFSHCLNLRKTRTRKNSVFGHFLLSVYCECGIIISLIRTQNGCTRSTKESTKEKSVK